MPLAISMPGHIFYVENASHQGSYRAQSAGYADRARSLHVPALDRHHVGCAWPFLALTHFELDLLTLIKCRVPAAAFNFRMMNEEIFSAAIGRDKSITFSRVEPLNCTFTHFRFLVFNGEP